MFDRLPYIIPIYYLFIIVMASNSTSSFSEDHTSGTDLSDIPTKEERRINTTTWSIPERKKLQHMIEFHEEYQRVFGEKASLRTIMKNRISHMNPPMPNMVCREEMQNATIENDVIIEYITDAQRRKVKKLKPLLIKSEPNREHVHYIHSDDNLPSVSEDKFTQKREITIDSYSETVSSESSSEDRTLTAETEDTPTSMEDHIENCTNVTKKENNVTEIESALHQIASSLQSAAGAYMTLASCINKLEPYEVPQVIAQIPLPPINVPMPIRKALTVDDEKKVVNHLIHGEYELTKTSWSKLQKKYNVGRGRIYSILKGKSMPRGSQYRQQKRRARKLETTTSLTSSELI